MPVDIFNRTQFEAALPVHKETKMPLWTSMGMFNGEYTYLLPVSEFASIMIRSSIDYTEWSATSGEDSIRLWLVDPKTYEPVGSKLSTYITRVNGWQVRMTAQLRTLYQLGKRIRPCGCGKGIVKILKTRQGVNQGRFFAACSADFKCQASPFQWLPDEFQAKKFRAS